MPRRNGKTPTAEGAPSARYAQRTDLAAQSASGMSTPTQPVRTPTGQGYGEAQALTQAQRAIPLPQPAEVPAPTAVTNLPGTLTPVAAQGYTPPNMGLGSSPSGRPNEPLTAGVPIGPGAPPNPAAAVQFTGGALLASLAAATGDASMARLADLADAQGF